MAEKLVFVIPNFRQSGAEKVAADYLNYVSNGKTEILCVCYNKEVTYTLSEKISFIYLDEEIPERAFKSRILKNMFRAVGIFKVLQANPGATVVSFMDMTNVLTIAASILLGRDVVIFERTINEKFMDYLRRRGKVQHAALRICVWIFYRYARKVVTLSHAMAGYLSRVYGLKNVAVIYNGVDDESFLFSYDDRAINQLRQQLLQGRSMTPSNYIICVAGFFDRKRHDRILNLLFRLKSSERRDLCLLLIGDGPLLPLFKEKVLHGGLSDYAIFMPRVARDAMPKFYNLSAVNILLSDSEGTPNAIIEGWTCGLPAVVTSSTPLELFPSDKAAITVGGDDVQSILNAIDCLCARFSHRSTRHELSVRAKKLYSNRLMFSKYDSVIFSKDSLTSSSTTP